MKQHITIEGIAVKGDSRGRALGFPTANLTLTSQQKLPQPGVYAAWAQLDGKSEQHPAAVHIGPRPTFNDATPTIEVHLLNFPDRDLYATTFKVTLIKHLRDIKKFASEQELIQALGDDCRQAGEILTSDQQKRDRGVDNQSSTQV